MTYTLHPKFTPVGACGSTHFEPFLPLLSFVKPSFNRNIKTANKPFRNDAKYLRRTITNQNRIHEAIKSMSDSETVCYHSVHNLLSSVLLSKITKIKTYRNTRTTFPFVLYWCRTWSLTLTEEHRLTVFENRVLRQIFGPKREEVNR
jgi:hypothetical protein